VKRYRFSAEAQDDIDDFRLHLTKEGGARAARRVLGENRRALVFLAGTPGAGRLRGDFTDEPVKFWSVFSYMIVYDPAAEPIGIARVVHGSQDLQSLFPKRPPRA